MELGIGIRGERFGIEALRSRFLRFGFWFSV
jgi:hypothetical protein